MMGSDMQGGGKGGWSLFSWFSCGARDNKTTKGGGSDEEQE